MVWVKICGVRDVESARLVAECRPDAIGLNFYPGSPRAVSAEVARSIARGLPAGIEAVGVFVNSAAADVAETVRSCALHRVQFHGDEPPQLLAEFHRLSPPTPIIRAWRFGPQGLRALQDYVARCQTLGVPVAAVLVDAHLPGRYGGTGVALPWDEVRCDYASRSLPPLILAGGLNADNVAAAVTSIEPWGVDVASGVESAPGVKDAELVARFVNGARGTTKKPHT